MVTPRTGNPRGRPKGGKNGPKTLDEFISVSLTAPKTPKAPKPPADHTTSAWGRMPPEERSAHAAWMLAKRRPYSEQKKRGRKVGVPLHLTQAQHTASLKSAKPVVARIIKRMADQGILPEDQMAVASLTTALTIMAAESTNKDKLAAASLILAYTKAKPTAKIEHTIKTAEDFLDEMSE